MKKALIVFYLLLIFSLFLYSFTQVDLGLTLTKLSIWQVIQQFFQNIGYFQRPLSTAFFLLIVFFLFIFYFLFLYLSKKKQISKKELFFIIVIVSLILGLSYNAFSYDLFNYIFDAKILTHYGQNPYIHKALDYQQDPMLSFMHWTHRTYPYGPVWLALTTSLSFIGMQYFLTTAILFKFLMIFSFLGTVFFIGKILKKISPQNELFGLVFFALNPLVLIESLVSAHNDIVMIFFSILAFYFLLSKNYYRSIIILLLSIGVKFASLFLLPVFALVLFFEKKKKEIPWEKVFYLSIGLMIVAVFTASLRTNFQPWYLLYVLPFAVFVSRKYFILIPSIIFSFFSLLQYAPFLYQGDWNPPVPMILYWLTLIPIILSVIFVVLWFAFAERRILCFSAKR